MYIIKELQINEEIRFREVRLIGDDGEQLGIVSSREALRIAEEKNLDLVLMSPNAKPPVCKIMDYGKYRYDTMKKAKDARKKQKTIELKEVRLSPNIEQHDLNVKATQARKFLSQGNKVKVSIRFRGRELGRTSVGYGVMDSFLELVNDLGQIEKKPKMEGRAMVMFLEPSKQE
ncbi:MAG: translation initiation factor IF-3 [Tissierellia bacterium]|nr:translation initiation factor IF-3 [Tissierellia bacterium]